MDWSSEFVLLQVALVVRAGCGRLVLVGTRSLGHYMEGLRLLLHPITGVVTRHLEEDGLSFAVVVFALIFRLQIKGFVVHPVYPDHARDSSLNQRGRLLGRCD